MKTRSRESDRVLEQAIRNVERKGSFYLRYAQHLRNRLDFLKAWKNLDTGRQRYSVVKKVFRLS